MANGGQLPTIGSNGLAGIQGSTTNGITHPNGMMMNGNISGDQTNVAALKNGSLASTAASTGKY
jgi:hypothetical protein